MKKRETKSEQIRRKRPYLLAEFDAYVLWKSMPAFLRGRSLQLLADDYGISDEFALDLLSIKTQAQFAQKFGIKHPGTLTEWNKQIETENLVVDTVRKWVNRFTPNVLGSLYRTIMKKGSAAEVKLWLQYVEGFSEKTKVEDEDTTRALEILTQTINDGRARAKRRREAVQKS